MKKIIALFLVALTAFGLFGTTAFAAATYPKNPEIVVKGNETNCVTISFEGEETHEVVEGYPFSFVYTSRYSQWQIGTKDPFLSKSKSVSGHTTTYTLKPQVNNNLARGTLVFAEYVRNKDVKTKWNATISRVYTMDYCLIDGKIFLEGGFSYTPNDIYDNPDITNEGWYLNPHSAEYDRCYIDPAFINIDVPDKTLSRKEVEKIATSAGCTSAMAATGATETKKVLGNPGNLYGYLRDFTNSTRTKHAIRLRYDSTKIKWLVGSVTNNSKVVWTRPLPYGLVKPMDTFVNAVGEGSAKVVFGAYKIDSNNTGKIEAIYVIDVTVKKGSDGKLTFTKFVPSAIYVGTKQYGVITSNGMDASMCVANKGSERTITSTALKKLLKQYGLPTAINVGSGAVPDA